MLVFTFKIGDTATVETPKGIIRVQLVGKHGRIGIDAPKDYRIIRQGVRDRIDAGEPDKVKGGRDAANP